MKKNSKSINAKRRPLNSRFVTRDRAPRAFEEILERRSELENFYSELNAELIINESEGIAYLKATEDGDDDSLVSFGRKKELTPLEGLILLYARKKIYEHEQSLESLGSAVCSLTEIRAFIDNFEKENNKKLESKIKASISVLKDLQVLTDNIDGESFTITPVCKVILPADKLKQTEDSAKIYYAAKEAQHNENSQSSEDTEEKIS